MGNQSGIMPEPCDLCPFRKTGDTGRMLNLHPERAQDFAYMASNPYTDFVCHKTAVVDESEYGSGDYVRGQKSLACHGFSALQWAQNESDEPVEWKRHPDTFEDPEDMIAAHVEFWEQQTGKTWDEF